MRTIECECGEILGEACQYEHRVGNGMRRVRLVYVPPSLRGTARAAGTIRGVTSSVLVTPECAEILLSPDEDTGLIDPWIMRPRQARTARRSSDRAMLAQSVASVLRAR